MYKTEVAEYGKKISGEDNDIGLQMKNKVE